MSVRPKPKRIVRPRTRGQDSARDELVIENLEWAHSIAERVAGQLPTWFLRDDLIGPAELALVRLAGAYDPSRGVPFRAYAQARLRGACYDAVRRREYRERAHVSLDADDPQYQSPNPHEVPGRSWHDWAARQGPTTEDSPQDTLSEAQSGVFAAVWHLPPRHQRIIILHYLRDVTIEEIAARMGVTPSRISQLHTEALQMLKEPISRLL